MTNMIEARLILARMFRLKKTIRLLEAILLLIDSDITTTHVCDLLEMCSHKDVDGILSLVVLNHGERGQEIVNLLK